MTNPSNNTNPNTHMPISTSAGTTDTLTLADAERSYLRHVMEKAMQRSPVFRTASPDVREDFIAIAETLLQKAMRKAGNKDERKVMGSFNALVADMTAYLLKDQSTNS